MHAVLSVSLSVCSQGQAPCGGRPFVILWTGLSERRDSEAEGSECSCRLNQLAAKKGLEVDWVQGMQGQDNSNSSGDGATETAISLSRWRADGGTAQSAMSKARALSSAGREHKQQQVTTPVLRQLCMTAVAQEVSHSIPSVVSAWGCFVSYQLCDLPGCWC